VNDWPRLACARLAQDGVVARVVVAEVLGSAPREAGACMLVSRDSVTGTIGGGSLEWQAISAARELFDAPYAGPAVRTRRLTLARDAGQCCGGVVQLWIERFTPADLPILRRAADAADSPTPATLSTEITPSGVTRSLSGAGGAPPRVHFEQADEGHATLVERLDSTRPPLWLYGAGHVGQALVRTLADLPFDVTWIDSRPELFPATTPARVHVLETQDPAAAASGAPSTARHIVMTHDHAIDYALCHSILSRNEFAWLGLIGSISKGARFRSRLRREGVPQERIDRLVCPIGLTDIRSKLPAAIAIGVAAQLLLDDQPRIVVQAAEECGADCASCRSHPRPLP